MGYKKEKQEIQFEEYQNGGLDKNLEEVKAKYNNKEIDAKQYIKEQKRIEKIKNNLSKVENLVKFRYELNDLKSMLEDELINRYGQAKSIVNSKEIDKKIEESDKKNEELLTRIDEIKAKLKNKNLTKNEIENLQKGLKENEKKLDANNKEFLELNARRNNNKQSSIEQANGQQFSMLKSDDLKKEYSKVCMKLSRNNFFAKRLLKGYDIESIKIEDKNIDWEAKKYTINAKQIEKIKKLKEAAKENEKSIDKSEKTPEKITEETEKKIGEDVKEIMKDKESTELIEVSEFERKHPRLAKIAKFFSNIKNKISNKKENDVQVDTDEQKKNDEAENNGQKIEEQQENNLQKEKEVPKNKHNDFIKRLNDMNQYEISDVAEKGMDGIKEDRMSEAKKRLMENKQKSAKASKDKYEQGLNDYYKNHGINKTKVDNTNYIDLSKNDDDARQLISREYYMLCIVFFF